MSKKISLIIPAKNEVGSLGKVISEIKKSDIVDEIIIVVDSDSDSSINIAKKNDCKIIVQKKGGYGSAIIEGFRFAKNDYACIYNADFSMDPKYLQRMIDKLNKNDFVFGTRYKGGSSEDDDIITFTGNKMFSSITKVFLGINLSDILYTYVLCDVEKFKRFNFKRNDFRFCIELPFFIHNNKYKYCEIPMHERKRYAGKKNVNVIKDGFLILCEIFYRFYKKFSKQND